MPIRLFCLCALSIGLTGCFFFGGFGPLEKMLYQPIQEQSHLVVMLPGLGDNHSDLAYFQSVSEVESLPNLFPGAGWLAVDANLGYYRNGRILEEFQRTVLENYPGRNITLLGVSLGGFGSIILSAAEPERYRELILVAPFLGDKDFIERVRREGLQSRPDDSRSEQAYLRIWRHLVEDKSASRRITVLVGEDDRFASAVDLLAEKAPAITVFKGPGGHNWTTWRQLWQDFLISQCPRTP